MRETILRPYRIIHGALLIRLISILAIGVALLIAIGTLGRLDFSGVFRYVRVILYFYCVVVMLSGLAVFFALTELRAASPWFARAGTLFIIEAAVNAMSDVSAAAIEMLSSRNPFAGTGAALAAIYSLTLAASLFAPMFVDLFMYGRLLRGYQEVCGTFGRDGENCSKLILRLRTACVLLMSGLFCALLAYTLLMAGASAGSFMTALAAVTALLLLAGAILRLLVQLRILRTTREIIDLVAEISF